jgi:uncharacterized protein with PhoU and TrkA domain
VVKCVGRTLGDLDLNSLDFFGVNVMLVDKRGGTGDASV